MAKEQLEAAVAEAAEELDKQIGLEEEKPPEVEVEASEEEDEEDEYSDSEADEAKRLYQALKDPKTAGAVIAALAQNAGILNKVPETKKEEAKAVKTVKEILSVALGKEYDFLAERLGPAIETILSQEREEANARFQEVELHRIENSVVSATDRLSRETKGESKKLEARMAALSEEVPIGTMSVDTYVKRLYTLAKAEHSNGSVKRNTDRVRSNANNAAERLHTASRVDSETKIPDRKMSLKESVNFALDQLAKR